MARRYDPWTRADEDELVARCKRGESSDEIAAAMHRSRSSVRNKMQALKCGIVNLARRDELPPRRPPPSWDDATAAAPAPPLDAAVRAIAGEVSRDDRPQESEAEFLDRVLGRTRREVQKAHTGSLIKRTLRTREPVGVAFTGDWHLSSTGPCAVDTLVEWAEVVRETPNLLVAQLGDLLDMPIIHDPKRAGDVEDDVRLADIVLSWFRDRLAVIVSGNHDDRTIRKAGFDLLRRLANDHDVPYRMSEALLLLEFRDPDTDELTARWLCALRHTFYRNSQLNPLHAPARWFEANAANWPEVEPGYVILPSVVILGHIHTASAGTRRFRGRPVHMGIVGPVQESSGYAHFKGFPASAPTAPVVIFPATQDREPVLHESLHEGARALRSLVGRAGNRSDDSPYADEAAA